MNLGNLLSVDRIVPQMQASERWSAIVELVELLVARENHGLHASRFYTKTRLYASRRVFKFPRLCSHRLTIPNESRQLTLGRSHPSPDAGQ